MRRWPNRSTSLLAATLDCKLHQQVQPCSALVSTFDCCPVRPVVQHRVLDKTPIGQRVVNSSTRTTKQLNASLSSGAAMPSILLANADRLDWDHALDLGQLSAVGQLTRENASASTLCELARGHELIVTKEMSVDRALVLALPESVRAICEAGTGYNNIDVGAARERGIVVCNVPTYSADAVAQLVITYVLNFSCSLHAQQRMLAQGDRSCFSAGMRLPHFELGGRTIGLIGGSGEIGSRVAEIARALGMRVVITSRRAVVGGAEVLPLDELLAVSDFVSIHCPLTAETRGLIDERALGRMRSDGVLINTARGGVVCEEALIDALQRGAIGGAALDVQQTEPPPPASPLYTLPNVILTPHVGWQRRETRQRLMDAVAQNCAAVLSGSPINVVNP